MGGGPVFNQHSLTTQSMFNDQPPESKANTIKHLLANSKA